MKIKYIVLFYIKMLNIIKLAVIFKIIYHLLIVTFNKDFDWLFNLIFLKLKTSLN